MAVIKMHSICKQRAQFALWYSVMIAILRFSQFGQIIGWLIYSLQVKCKIIISHFWGFVKKNNKGNNMKNIVKKKKVSFKYVLFWVLGILGAILAGYFLFVGSMV